jgi:hypothetical protein
MISIICKYLVFFRINTMKKLLTPKAENRLVRLGGSGPRKTSDFGRGGRRGRRITLASSLISSSKSFESLETDSCLCTLSRSPMSPQSRNFYFLLNFYMFYSKKIIVYNFSQTIRPIFYRRYITIWFQPV